MFQAMYQQVHNLTVKMSNVLLVLSLLEQEGIISPEKLQAEQERLKEKAEAERAAKLEEAENATVQAEEEEEERPGEGDSGLDHRDASD